MKILYIANARIPTEKAHGYQIAKMCEAFALGGVDVTLIVPERHNNITDDLFTFYGVQKLFQIKYIKSFDFFQLEKYIGRFAFYLQSILFIFKLFFLNVDKNTIIYTRNPELVWLFCLRGFSVGYECHDWFAKNKTIALYFLNKAKYIFTTNQFIANEFINNGFAKPKIFVAPNGVSLEVFDSNLTKQQAVSKLNLPVELKSQMLVSKVLVYTGSFLTMGVSKGIDEILSALTQIKTENVIFIAYGGSTEDIVFYENKAKSMGITNAYFFPRQSQAKLALIQKSADILLMPFPKKAHYEYHMAPLKMFEYQVSKRPIIASDLPSIKQILNENNCLFCKSDNPTDLASKIDYLLANHSIGEKLAQQAYNDVKQYSWQNRAKRIIDVIK